MLALAAVAFALGAIVGANRGASASTSLASQFVAAWTHGEYSTMYADIDAAARRDISPSEFAALYGQALRAASATRLAVAGPTHAAGASQTVPVKVTTRLFGTLPLDFVLSVQDTGEGPRVRWSRSLEFPGMRPGERLSRHTMLPRRAALLGHEGGVLAEGDAEAGGEVVRTSPLGESARAVVGTVGPAPAARAASLEAEGVPAGASVGLSGLERALDGRLRGTLGGALLAGTRVLAYAAPRAAAAVRTTVSPALQSAAVTALGGRLGGVVVMRPSGEILAVAGIGLEGLQPPGSTFKMITLTGALEGNVATPRTVFPYASYATLDGVKLSNANGENCGGSLELAFATSCNSVFTPLGVKLGAPRLVAAAERFGFNQPPAISGAATSTLPAASRIQGELALGSTAIGQGQVLATPLEMATVAATIADGGRRPRVSFLAGESGTPVPVTSAAVASTVRRLMIGVVRQGTGTSAAIPGVTVAGKTGTAELKTPCTSSTEASSSEPGSSEKSSCAREGEASNTDAWFAAFAPALHPRVVVCVMLVKDGAGGETAAPAAREVLETGLRVVR